MIEIREPGFGSFKAAHNLGALFYMLDCCHESCDCDDVESMFFKGHGRKVNQKPHAEIFLCTALIDGYTEQDRFLDLLERPNEFEETFASLGMTVNVHASGTLAELRKSLDTSADFRWIFAHGEEFAGIRCADGDLEWQELIDTMSSTGLLYISSCYSANAYCEDEEDYYPFIDGITDVASAVVASVERAHHLPWRYAESDTHFEIQRVAFLLKSCFEVGFKKAVLRTQRLIRERYDKTISSTIIDHEVCRGHSKWGLL